jgi:choice-of-anchor B domain-containing protein
VYTYRMEGGIWSRQSMLTASDSSRMDDFGRALAVDGNTLVVGAPRKRDGSGVAYAFQRGTGGGWQESAIIVPPQGDDHREYAAALALSGEDLLVGSPAAGGTGVVYHLRRSGSAWNVQGTIRPGADAGQSGFGSTLAWEGDRLLVGAPDADSARGRVYVVERGAGGWGEPTRLPLTGADAVGARAGSAVLMVGERAFVGAPGTGNVFVLRRDGSGSWSAESTLLPPEDPRASRFGASLALAGGDLWVGAPGVDGAKGRVYSFRSDTPEGWRRVATLEPDATVGAVWPMGFGYAMATAGERGVVGMPSRDFGEGRVMALRNSGGAWQPGEVLEGVIYRIGNALEIGARCEEGAMGEFPCTNMELVGHLSVDDLGGERGVWVNDVWGWTDPDTGRDYALVARRDGASFIDVTEPSAPRLVGNLSRTLGSRPSVWRDIKVIGNHAYIVADGAGAHGMQVFDLTRLRGVMEPVDFDPDLTYTEIFSAHNIAADTESGFLYIAGANTGGQTCGGGLHIVDATDPGRPVFAGCHHDPDGPGSRGFAHDAQCLVYRGPDVRYREREICVGSNESEINIADMTDKSNPVTIGRQSYPNVAYAHQGWFDEEQRYFYMNDELDESAGTVEGTRTLIWDLASLDDPILAGEYIGPVMATDHNLYIVGDRMYQSNYGSGLRVIDISDRLNPYEMAFFDSAPYNDDGPGASATESGAWSNYPFFPSGLVIFTSVREGLFIMRVTPPPAS